MACCLCCLDMDIRPEHLLFPGRMSAVGQEFVRAHGLDAESLGDLRASAQDMGNGLVRIFHRCAQLTPEGLCGIYATRPAICRDFNCATRGDCQGAA